jgi:hypothetical protein
MSSRFVHQSNDRRLPADYRGDVLLWDIDKTYLDTHFSSFRGLARIPFELAVDKQTVPGAVPLLRARRRGSGSESAVVPLYFVSGSPPQLRAVIERKMTLDGVDFDGITFKDQLGLLLSRRPGDIREQLGYKLCALLSYYRALPVGARWLTFGDDVEADAEAFLLFGEIVAGLRAAPLSRRLRRLGVSPANVEAVLQAAPSVSGAVDPVQAVFIHTSRGPEPGQHRDPRVVTTRSYVQSAAKLVQLGRVQPAAVAAVAREQRLRGMAEATLQAHLDDAEARLGVPTAVTALARAP